MVVSTRHDRGFSLIELLAVIFILTILAAVAVAIVQPALESMRLAQSVRDVERGLQTARLKAVTTNRRLRLRMNCPAAGTFRMVEFLGNVNDTAANRCAEAAYPYPAADRDPITVPNYDGPVQRLYAGATVPTVTFEFRPDGTAWTVNAAGVAQAIPVGGTQLTVTRKSKTRSVNINALGKIQLLQ